MGEAARAGHIQAGGRELGRPQPEQRQRARHPLDRLRALAREREEALDVAGRELGDQHRAQRRQFLQTRGDTHHLSLGGVVHAQVIADLADDDRAGIDADGACSRYPVPATSFAASGASRSWIASAARQARLTWSSAAIGAPNRAMMPSPVY